MVAFANPPVRVVDTLTGETIELETVRKAEPKPLTPFDAIDHYADSDGTHFVSSAHRPGHRMVSMFNFRGSQHFAYRICRTLHPEVKFWASQSDRKGVKHFFEIPDGT